MTTLHQAIALQGITPRFSRQSAILQGFFVEAVATHNIVFAQYLWALQSKIILASLQSNLIAIPITANIYLMGITTSEGVSHLTLLPQSLTETLTVITTAMTDFFIKKGDTLPRIESTLKYSTGAAVNLTGASQVQFTYKHKQQSEVTIKTGTIIDATLGKVAYSWQPGDTAIIGDYQAEWQITFSGGGILTIPNDGTFIEFRIVPSLD